MDESDEFEKEESLSPKACGRRRFITQIFAASAIAVAWPAVSRAERLLSKTQILPFSGAPLLLKDPWRTLKLVQQHLLPSSAEMPGADDIKAIDFLKKDVIQDNRINPSEKKFITAGVPWLNSKTKAWYGKAFVDLSYAKREKTLTIISKDPIGKKWLSVILSHLFEALFSDPVYGSNVHSIGWQWVNQQPGFPRPTRNKRYQELASL